MTRSAKTAFFAAAALAAFAPALRATDYYVSVDGDDESDGLSAEYPFATLDKAIITATAAGDVIHVATGEYLTGYPEYVAQTDNAKWGPNLKAKLVGGGASRDGVVIKSHGEYRTLRMAAGSWLENVTVVGVTDISIADRGGAIEISGGTVTNCVVRDGTSYANGNVSGGNLYVNNNDALVVDCEIYGGRAKKRGGNVYLDRGTVLNCTIHDGVCEDNIGGNVYQYQGLLKGCTIYGGTALNDGGNVRMNGSGTMEDCYIYGGVVQANEKKGANVYMDSSAKMSRCRLSGGSHAGGYNGGSLAIGSATAVVEDCLVEGSECGGVLFVGTSYLYNCTVVDNDKYGIWAWNASSHVFDTVIYGNTENGSNKDWTGNITGSSGEFVNNAVTESGSRHTTSAYPSVVLLADDSAFADYAGGDYRPAAGGPLVDAGASDTRGVAASTTDLDGNLRTSGVIDIGCYEYQKPDMVVHIDDAQYSQAFAPATVVFSHSTDNSASPENVVFTYDFGDGSDAATTAGGTISHEYAEPGIYTVAISAVNDCEEEEAEMVYEGYVRVASSTVYVTPGNPSAGTFPFDTPEKGYGNLKTAVQNALDGYTLLLGEGVHETVDQVSFNKALVLRGVGDTPEAVVVRNVTATPDTYYHRTLEMNNAAGRIENLTIENGCVRNQNGGNLRLVTGVVSNCVIRGGLAVADGGNAAGAGVELAGAGTLTHCIVSNNVVRGTSSNGGLTGGAVFVTYNAKNGRVSNCLVAGNVYETSGDTVKSGAAGIRFGGSNDNTQIENNTVAGNVVDGELSEDSAGIHCTTWYGRLRNNVVVGNYETGKAKYTSVKVDFDHCTWVGNVTDDDTAPESLFEDFAGCDYRPRPGSVAFNAGVLDGLVLLPGIDLDGEARVAFGKIDAGCYECQALPATVLVVR
ncbi:MAG: PKD domain-containing protein [Kiritimatiellae bacterium]|nr:PKD domain-containing protein [Kiritimatiellia bacterium]